MSEPIQLFYWPTANGRKISIALEEMALDYVLKPVDLMRGEQTSPAFLEVSPNGRMPAIIDPEGPGGEPITIFESGAILQYLGRKSGKLYPTDERARAEVETWLYWQVAGLGPIGGQTSYFRDYAPAPLKPALQRFERELERLYGVLDKRLAGRLFVAGDYSIADIGIYGWVRGHKRQRIDLGKFDNVASWLARISARPAVQRGDAAGDHLVPAHLNPGSPAFDVRAMQDNFMAASARPPE